MKSIVEAKVPQSILNSFTSNNSIVWFPKNRLYNNVDAFISNTRDIPCPLPDEFYGMQSYANAGISNILSSCIDFDYVLSDAEIKSIVTCMFTYILSRTPNAYKDFVTSNTLPLPQEYCLNPLLGVVVYPVYNKSEIPFIVSETGYTPIGTPDNASGFFMPLSKDFGLVMANHGESGYKRGIPVQVPSDEIAMIVNSAMLDFALRTGASFVISGSIKYIHQALKNPEIYNNTTIIPNGSYKVGFTYNTSTNTFINIS